jgi:hypothetical protein
MQTEEEVRAYIRNNWLIAKQVVGEINETIEDLGNDFNNICHDFDDNLEATTRIFALMKFHPCIVFDPYGKPRVKALKFHRTRDFNAYHGCFECNKSAYELVTCACRQQRRCMNCLLNFHKVTFDYENYYDYDKNYKKWRLVKDMFAMDFLDAKSAKNLNETNTSFFRLLRKIQADNKYFNIFKSARSDFPFLDQESYDMFRVYIADDDAISTLIYCFERKNIDALLF